LQRLASFHDGVSNKGVRDKKGQAKHGEPGGEEKIACVERDTIEEETEGKKNASEKPSSTIPSVLLLPWAAGRVATCHARKMERSMRPEQRRPARVRVRPCSRPSPNHLRPAWTLWPPDEKCIGIWTCVLVLPLCVCMYAG
jgi:hypothetical protein